MISTPFNAIRLFMNIVKDEIPLGGGEGSVIYFRLQIGNVLVNLATSRSIKCSPVQKNWVKELSFLDPFDTFEELKEILEECDDKRLAEYVHKEIGELLGMA